MKKVLFIIAFLTVGAVNAQELNAKAKMLKSEEPKLYNDLKTFAVDKWKTKHRMVVYEINRQTDALFEMYDLANEPDYDKELMIQSMAKWRKEIKGELYYNWPMVIYNYKRELTAKKSY